MENQNEQNQNPTPPVSPVEQAPPVSSPINPPAGRPRSKLPFLKIGIILFLLIAGSAAGFYVFKQLSLKTSVKPIPTPIVQKQNPTFLTKIDPSAELPMYQYPNLRDINGVANYENDIFVSSYGTLAITDKTGQIISYIDPKKYFCFTNPIIKNAFLYVGCYETNLVLKYEDILKQQAYLYKIDVKNKLIASKYKVEDLSGNWQSWHLYGDGDDIWLSYTNPIIKFNTVTDTIETGNMGVNQVIVDRDYVWARGGGVNYLNLYDKKTKTWKSFGLEDVNTHILDSSDTLSTYYLIESWKKVDGGMEYSNWEDVSSKKYCSVRKYTYATGKFETIIEKTLPGGESRGTGCLESLKEFSVPLSEDYSGFWAKSDKNGFTQLLSEFVPEGYVLNGREYIASSRSIGKKRYLLSSVSLDVLQENSRFPNILIPFGKEIEGSYNPPGSTALIIDDEENYAVGFGSPCPFGGEGPRPVCGNVKVLDLRGKKVIEDLVYVSPTPQYDEGFFGSDFKKFTLQKRDNTLIITSDKGKKIAEIDLKTFELISDNLKKETSIMNLMSK